MQRPEYEMARSRGAWNKGKMGILTGADARKTEARRERKKRTEWVAMFAPIVGEEAARRALDDNG